MREAKTHEQQRLGWGQKVSKPTIGTSNHGKFGMLQLVFSFLPETYDYTHTHTYIYIYILSKIEWSSPRLPLNLEGDYLRYQSKKGRKSTEDAIRFHEEVQKKTVSPRV